jgi:hypothetical protein
MEIHVTHTAHAARPVPVTIADRVTEYGRTLSDAQLTRLFRRIADRTRLDEFGDYATYAVCYPHAYRALRTLSNLHAERVHARTS